MMATNSTSATQVSFGARGFGGHSSAKERLLNENSNNQAAGVNIIFNFYNVF